MGGAGGWRIDRRRFLLTGAAGVVAAVAAGGIGNALARRFRADESRAAVNIPKPASRASTLPAGTELNVAGLGPRASISAHRRIRSVRTPRAPHSACAASRS